MSSCIVHCTRNLEAFHDGWPIEVGSQQLRIRFLSSGLEAKPSISRYHCRVTMQTSAALGSLCYALGHLLVIQHVGVAACFSVVKTKRVPRIEPAKPWIPVQLACRHRAGATEFCFRVINSAPVTVKFVSPIDSPRHRVSSHLIDVDQPHERNARL